MSTRDTPTGLDDPELRAAVHQLVAQMVGPAREQHGPLPGVGTPPWWAAPADVQLAALLVLAEAHLIADPQSAAATMLKDASTAISGGLDWTAAATNPSHAELARRRDAPGPAGRDVDPHAAARWAATGNTGAEVKTA